MTKFNSSEEVKDKRKELLEKYNGELPDYLEEYLDTEELKKTKAEYYDNIRKEQYSNTPKERYEFKVNQEEEFWNNNKYEIVKKPPTTNHPVYKEPPKAVERVEEEVGLSEVERLALIQMCERDMYLFAIRYFPHYLKKPSSKLHRYLYKTFSLNFNKKRTKGMKLAIAAPRHGAKCLKYNTNIQLTDGSLKEIKDINVDDKIISFNSNFKQTTDKVIGKVYSGKKKVRDVIFKTGRKITATDDHRFFDIHGEIKLKDTVVGTKLATPRFLECTQKSNTMLYDEAVFLANMLAEGCISKGRKLRKSEGYSFKCSYTNFDKKVVDDFSESCLRLGFRITNTSRDGAYNIQGAIPYLRKLGLGGTNSHTKFIPSEVFKQDNKFLRIFLTRFIDTDGWISKNKASFGITLANERMIDQLFTIFLRLGFRPFKNYCPNKCYGAWSLIVNGIDQLRLLSTMGLVFKQEKLLNTIEKFYNSTELSRYDTIDKSWRKYLKNTTLHFLRKEHNIRVDTRSSNTTRSKLKKVADVDNNDFLLKLAESDIYWDEVVGFSDYYYVDTYDIETEKHHNFIANNIFSHNSSVVSCILPIWCVVYEKKKFIMMVSDTADQAVDFLTDVKNELVYNEKLIADFPHVCGKGPTWRLNDVITNNQVKIMALGTGNKIRGRKFGIHRPDLFIGDDLENSEMVRSKTQREYIRGDWFDKDVAHVGGEEGSQTDFIVVGTVLGKDSLLNSLLDPKEYPEWRSMRFQAVEKFSDSGLWDDWERILKDRFNDNRLEDARAFFDKNKEEMLEGTKVLWPEGDPYYDLMIQRATNPSSFLCEKQNSAVDSSKIYVTEDQLHWESFVNPKIQKLLKTQCDYFGALDPSLGKKSNKGDYSAIITIAKERKSGYMYVVDIDLKRRSVDSQISDILKKHKQFRYKLFGVETNAFQYVVADALRKIAREESKYVPITEVNQYQDKKLRFEGVLPFLLDGTIVFDTYRRTQNQMYDLGIEQICTFTGENDAHDDAPDCLATLFEIAKRKRFRMITRQTK